MTDRNYALLGIFVLTALLLALLSNSARYFTWFGKQPVLYARFGMKYLLPWLSCLILLAVSLICIVPAAAGQSSYAANSIRLPLVTAIQSRIDGIFAQVNVQKPDLSYNNTTQLVFSGPPKFNGYTLYVVKTTQTYSLWETNVYDVYTDQGWLTSSGQYQNLAAGSSSDEAQTSADDIEMSYTVIPQENTNILLDAGELLSSDTPLKLNILTPDDIVGVLSAAPMSRYQQCTITSLISTASPDQLSEAGQVYPTWVTSRYLQLPSAFPSNITQLAENITSGIQSPYQKAVAILDYLSQFPYSMDFAAPPDGVDGVENFLFSAKTGDCLYFASAMTVMLRSIGIPARIASGYVGLNWDPQAQGYDIKDSDSHAWTEVYFPGYGWITFDPTPGAQATPNQVVLPSQSTVVASEQPDYFDEDEMQIIPAQPVISPSTDSGSISPSTQTPVQEYPGSENTQLVNVPETTVNAPAPIEQPPSVPVTGQPPPSDVQSAQTQIVAVAAAAGFPPWLIPITLALLSLMGFIVYRAVVSFNNPKSVSSMYARMCRLSWLAGLNPRRQQTPLEHCLRLSVAIPAEAVAFRDIVEAYTLVSYSRSKEMQNTEQRNLLKSWRRVRRALFGRIFIRTGDIKIPGRQ